MTILPFFILILFFIAALFRVDFFFHILYIFLGIYLLARLWTRRALEGVDCARRFQERAFLDERVTVRLEIANRGLLPLPWLKFRESLPIQLSSPNFFQRVVSLLPWERVGFSYQLHCRRRGFYRIGPLALSAGDVFGIAERRSQGAPSDHLIVYPKIVPLRELGLPSRSPFGTLPSRQRIFEDPTRVMGVRDYQAGDSLRHINWKTSASVGQLQVKRYQPAVSLETAIFLNLNTEEYRRQVRDHRRGQIEKATELAIVVAASIANHLVERRQAVGLSTNGRDPLADAPRAITLPPAKGRAHLMGTLDILARVEASDTFPFVDLLRRESLHLPWGATAVVITGTETDDLFGALLGLQRKGLNVVLVLVDPQTAFSPTRRRAQQVGFQAYALWRERDLDIWR